MINLVNVAVFAHRMSTWLYPYDTGNLVASAGDVGQMYGGVGYRIFNANQRASYGQLLNEAETITRTYTTAKGTNTHSYQNRHYRWVDNMVDIIANEIDLSFNTRRG